MAILIQDEANYRTGLVVRNALGRLDPVCDETGKPLNFMREFQALRSSEETRALMMRVKAAVEKRESPSRQEYVARNHKPVTEFVQEPQRGRWADGGFTGKPEGDIPPWADPDEAQRHARQRQERDQEFYRFYGGGNRYGANAFREAYRGRFYRGGTFTVDPEAKPDHGHRGAGIHYPTQDDIDRHNEHVKETIRTWVDEVDMPTEAEIRQKMKAQREHTAEAMRSFHEAVGPLVDEYFADVFSRFYGFSEPLTPEDFEKIKDPPRHRKPEAEDPHLKFKMHPRSPRKGQR